MKTIKLMTLALLLTFTFSCNKDDDSNEEQIRNWTAYLEDVCGEQSTEFTACITEEEKERAFDQTVIGEPCNWVSIEDIDGNNHSGYWRGAATGSNSCE